MAPGPHRSAAGAPAVSSALDGWLSPVLGSHCGIALGTSAAQKFDVGTGLPVRPAGAHQQTQALPPARSLDVVFQSSLWSCMLFRNSPKRSQFLSKRTFSSLLHRAVDSASVWLQFLFSSSICPCSSTRHGTASLHKAASSSAAVRLFFLRRLSYSLLSEFS